MGYFTAFRADAYPGRSPEFSDRRAFSLKTAGALAWAAQLAYEIDRADKADAIIARWGWAGLTRLSGQPVPGLPLVVGKGFAARIGTTGILAFAGTEPENPQDWIVDLSSLASQGMHDGFRSVVELIWPGILTATEAADAVLLTGHSLGGALALVAALRLAGEPALARKLCGIYTFGQPRVLTAGYLGERAGLPTNRIYRFVHGADIVPRLPPALAPLHYRHVGLLAACERQGRFAATPAAAPIEDDYSDSSILAALGSAITGPFTGNNEPAYPGENEAAVRVAASFNALLRDHLMDNYLRALGVF